MSIPLLAAAFSFDSTEAYKEHGAVVLCKHKASTRIELEHSQVIYRKKVTNTEQNFLEGFQLR